MDQTLLQPTTKATVQTAARPTSRLFFLDHLRAALVTLVVLHHLAVIYGAVAPFYYVEPPLADPLAYLVLLTFVLFNQAWFMGTLFLIAGYFTPGSFERKGSGSFLKGRLVRLGIPLLLFYFVLGPISATGFWQMPASLTGITSPLTWDAYPYLLGLGPLWFVAMLLIFDIGYAVWRALTKGRISTLTGQSALPGYRSIGVFILALALTNYLIRMVIPLGKDVWDFPTLSYLPQYLSFFVLGTIAYRRNWLQSVPRSMGVVGLVAAIVVSVVLFPLALSGRLFSLEVTEAASFVGNGTWQSAVYALWDATFSIGLFLAALTFFRGLFNGENRFGKLLSQQSYAVYVIHAPIVVWIAIASKGVQLAPLVKFGLVAVIAVPVCFVAAFAIRKIPFASRVF